MTKFIFTDLNKERGQIVELVWGVFLTIVTLVAWIGQIIYAVSPALAVKLGLGEAETDVDATFYMDARGEAIWDSFVLWTLPTAGILLVLNSSYWAYFGLIGGGAYIYFAGRNLVTRVLMQGRGIRIGTLKNIKTAYFFVSLWGATAFVTIIYAVVKIGGNID